MFGLRGPSGRGVIQVGYVVDEETGEVMVEVDREFLERACPFGRGWLAGDQWVLLGEWPNGRTPWRGVVGRRITRPQADAVMVLRDKIRAERERSKSRYPRVGPA